MFRSVASRSSRIANLSVIGNRMDRDASSRLLRGRGRRRLQRLLAGLSLLLAVGCDGDLSERSADKPAQKAPEPLAVVQTVRELDASAPTGRAPETEAATDRAIQLVRQGKTLEAEALVEQHVGQIKKRYGGESREYAWAQYDRGAVYLSMGQSAKANDALRKACDVPTQDDEQAVRDRLTFMMNLGEVLEFEGQLGEAERVLRDSLKERAGFYGRDHAGYGYGLEPLAAVLSKSGKHEEARRLVEEAVAVFKANQHPHVVTAMALRARVLAAGGDGRPLFSGTEEVPEELVPDLVDAVIQGIDLEEPAVHRQVLNGLLPTVRQRLGDTHAKTLEVLIALSNVERVAGDHQRRQQVLRQILAAYEALGREPLAIETLGAIAVAQGDAGQPEAAINTYKNAKTRAAALGSAAIQSAVARNYGLYLAELERFDEARRELEAALAKAKASGKVPLTGSAEVALGIFCQHRGDPDTARALLTSACESLDPACADALCAKSHLTAMETGVSCGCNEETFKKAVSHALRQYVAERAPKGLLEDVIVDFDENQELKLDVKLAREPTPEEQKQLDRLLRHALADFRKKIQQGFGADVYQQPPEK